MSDIEMNEFYPSLLEVCKTMSRKGYKVFDSHKGLDLNIVGIRTNENKPDDFNDYICVFYRNQSSWSFHVFNATTDPSLYWLENPMKVQGTAILKANQYRGTFKIGKHRGQYDALVQAKEVEVYRDPNRDAQLDLFETEKGFFGINIHRASAHRSSKTVGKWSAGCQVIQCPVQYRIFMELCKQSAKMFGPTFTYTLLEQNDFKDGV